LTTTSRECRSISLPGSGRRGAAPGPRSGSTGDPRTLWGHETWGQRPGEAEARFREAHARHAPDAEVRGPAEAFDAALTAAMRAAYAAQRAEIGPRGYDDRIFRRKARATPRVHALTAEAERLLTLRETHRLNDIPAVTYDPAP